MNKDLILNLIEEQKKIIKNAEEQLKKLCEIAKENGIYVENTNNSSIKEEIENKRRDITASIEKMKQDVMSQVQSIKSQMPNNFSIGQNNIIKNIGEIK